MTKFADQLFTDLLAEHGPALDQVALPARRTVPRPVWLAAGVVGMAGAVTAGMTVFGSGTPAYAVTANGDGTVTISINQMSGVDGANGALRGLGDRVVVVPVRPGCPAFDKLPHANPGRGWTSLAIYAGHSGTITVGAHGVPAGDTMLVAASETEHGIVVAGELITGPAPRCVSDVLVHMVKPWNGTVSWSDGGQDRPGPSSSGTSNGH